MITVEIKKAIFGSYVSVRDKYLNIAKNTHQSLRIRCNGVEAVVTPSQWKKTGKRIRKVFLIPDHPMTLWANHLSRFVKKEKPKVSPLNTIYKMPAKYRNRIRKILKVKHHLTKSV